jgi:aminopeptidase N
MRYGDERSADVLRRYRKNLLDSGPHGVKEQIGPISMGPRLVVWKGRPDSVYSEVVYEKGAYVLEMIRGLFLRIQGGDEPFFAMMREFVEASKGRRTCTEDFRLAVEKALGIPMDWFFDQWVYGTGIPRLEVSYRRTEGGYTFRVEQDPATEFQMLVPVTFHFGGKKTSTGVLKVKPGTSETHIPMERGAKSIEINAGEENLVRVELTSKS